MNEGGDDPTQAPDDVAVDTMFDLLSVRERRSVLYALVGTGPISFDALADRVTGPDTTEQTRDRVLTALRHAHLPRFLDAGVVTVDEERREVCYDGGESLTTWLHWARLHEPAVGTPEQPTRATAESDRECR